MTSKDWYKSKTVWFAALTVVLGVAASVFGFNEWVPDGETADLIAGIVLVVGGGIQLGLRLVTK